MNTQLTDSKIFTVLSAILVEALRIDPTKITMESKIFHDLGAESIDILDIRFRTGRAFGFTIVQDEFIRSLGEGLSASQIQEKFTVGSLFQFIKHRLQQQVKIS